MVNSECRMGAYSLQPRFQAAALSLDSRQPDPRYANEFAFAFNESNDGDSRSEWHSSGVSNTSGVARCIEAVLKCMGEMDHPFREIRVYSPEPISTVISLLPQLRQVTSCCRRGYPGRSGNRLPCLMPMEQRTCCSAQAT